MCFLLKSVFPPHNACLRIRKARTRTYPQADETVPVRVKRKGSRPLTRFHLDLFRYSYWEIITVRLVIIAPGAEINCLSVKMKLNWTDPLRVGEAACHRGVGNLDVSFAVHGAVELCDNGGIHYASGKRDACAKRCRLAINQFEDLFRASLSQCAVVAGREVSLLPSVVDWRSIRQR